MCYNKDTKRGEHPSRRKGDNTMMKYYELKNKKTNEEFVAYGKNFKDACKNAGHNFREVHLVYCTPVLEGLDY